MTRRTPHKTVGVSLGYAIDPAAEEFEEAEVAEDLELLADFGTDVVIVGMQPSEAFFLCVNFAKREFGFAECSDSIEDVECPTSLFERYFGQGLKSLIPPSYR